jgi:peptidoglycan hydrolase-like protein with peptidoglycan-binding domain
MKYFVFVLDSGYTIFSNHPDPTFPPLVPSLQSYFSEIFKENVYKLRYGNKMKLVFQQYQNLSFLVCSDQGESEAFLRMQLNLAYQLLCLEFGGKLYDKNSNTGGFFLKHSDRIRRLLDTMCLLCDEKQSFLVQSIEELLRFSNPNSKIQEDFNNILKNAIKDVPVIAHALLFANTQLVAQFSQPKVFELATADVILLIIWFWSHFHHKGGIQMPSEVGTQPPFDDFEDSNDSFHSATEGSEDEFFLGGEPFVKNESTMERLRQQIREGLTPKSSGEAVELLQLVLHANDVYDGDVTAHYTEAIRSAVANFQRQHDLEPNGLADLNVLRLLAKEIPEEKKVEGWSQALAAVKLLRELLDSMTPNTDSATSPPVRIPSRSIQNHTDMPDRDQEGTILASSIAVPFDAPVVGNRVMMVPPQALHFSDTVVRPLLSVQHSEGTSLSTTSPPSAIKPSDPVNVTHSQKKFTEKREASDSSYRSENANCNVNPSNSTEIDIDLIESNYVTQETITREEPNSNPSSDSNSPFCTPTNIAPAMHTDQKPQEEPDTISVEQTKRIAVVATSQPTESQRNAETTTTTTAMTSPTSAKSNQSSSFSIIFQNLHLRAPHYTVHCHCFVELLQGITLVLVCKKPNAKLTDEEREKLRNTANIIKEKLMADYVDYILSLEKVHTMVYYVDKIPGLVHFILVDRTYNRVLAPVITPLGGSQSQMNQNPDLVQRMVTVLKRAVWQLVYQSQQFLSKGFCDMIMKKGHFIYSYKLWFEDSSGRVLPIKDPINFDHKLPLNRDFYKKLQNRLFAAQRAKCYELYSLYLGFLPLKTIDQNNQLLASMLLRQTE